MAAEKFVIDSEIIYTIKSAEGEIKITGYEKLKEHGENILGASEWAHHYASGLADEIQCDAMAADDFYRDAYGE